MIRILLHDDQGMIKDDVAIEALSALLRNHNNLLWIDLAQEPAQAVERVLADTFDFHPLAIDDAVNEIHVPKVDEWPNYLYVVLRAVEAANLDEQDLLMPELDFFLGKNFLVTYSAERNAAIDRVWARCAQDKRWMKRGSDHLLYRLADEVVADMINMVEAMYSDLDEIEEQIFGEAEPETLEALFTLKRNILRLRRIVLPQREVMQKLSRYKYEVIDKVDRIYFRDVYDHLLQLYDLLDELLVLVSSALDTYLSVVNNRMNDVMKTLTVITALFMPLAFISGFFGMNFFAASGGFEGWTGAPAFVTAVLIMLLVPALMFYWMRRQTWV